MTSSALAFIKPPLLGRRPRRHGKHCLLVRDEESELPSKCCGRDRVLTRELVRPQLSRVTVAPITRTLRGLSTELPLEHRNGIENDSVASLDNVIQTGRVLSMRARQAGVQIGRIGGRAVESLGIAGNTGEQLGVAGGDKPASLAI